MTDNPPIYTILALILIPILAVTVYFGFPIIGNLQIFEAFLLAVLSVYGITAFLKLRKAIPKSIYDLFPGVVEDRYLVGFDGLASCVFLFAFGFMPESNFIAFATLILGALGLLHWGAD